MGGKAPHLARVFAPRSPVAGLWWAWRAELAKSQASVCVTVRQCASVCVSVRQCVSFYVFLTF